MIDYRWCHQQYLWYTNGTTKGTGVPVVHELAGEEIRRRHSAHVYYMCHAARTHAREVAGHVDAADVLHE